MNGCASCSVLLWCSELKCLRAGEHLDIEYTAEQTMPKVHRLKWDYHSDHRGSTVHYLLKLPISLRSHSHCLRHSHLLASPVCLSLFFFYLPLSVCLHLSGNITLSLRVVFPSALSVSLSLSLAIISLLCVAFAHDLSLWLFYCLCFSPYCVHWDFFATVAAH